MEDGKLYRHCVVQPARGEIPKRLKGLPWKGSRSLIAARGFKSLFLRLNIWRANKLYIENGFKKRLYIVRKLKLEKNVKKF